MAAAIVIIFFSIRSISWKKPSFYVILFSALIVFFTLLQNPHEVDYALFYTIRLFAFFLLFERIIEKNYIKTCTFIVVYESVIIFINTVFQLIMPDAFGYNVASRNNYNFFVSDNELPYVYMGFLAFLAVYSWKKDKRINNYVYMMLLLCTFSVFVSEAGAGRVGFLLVCAAIMVPMMIRRFLTFGRVLIAYAVVYISIVKFEVYKYFSWFITEVLKKDITLSSRTYLWGYAMDYIKDHLFIGKGTVEGGRILFIPTGPTFHSSHSFFLEILVQGGIFGLLFFILIYVSAGRHLKKLKGKKIYGFIIACLSGMLLMYVSEGWIYQPLQYMMPISMFWLTYGVNGNGEGAEENG